MSLTGKNRKQITDLRQSVQLSELNRQLDWIWQQLLGGLSFKSLNSDIQSSLSDSALLLEMIRWIIAGGESAETMTLTSAFMLAVAKDINENGRIAVGAFNTDLSGLFAQGEDGKTYVNIERIPEFAALEKRVKALEDASGGET